MSRRIRLTARAQQDIRAILAHSSSAFGVEQAKIYNGKIKRTLESLRNTKVPTAIRLRDDLASGLRSCRVLGSGVRHLVFFSIDGDTVTIVRILHEAMDFSRHIGAADGD